MASPPQSSRTGRQTAVDARGSSAASQDPLGRGVVPLAPCDRLVEMPVDALTARPTGMDGFVLKALKPVARDKLSLMPVHYQASLAEAATVLARLGAERGSRAIVEAAQLLDAELALMDLVASRRALIARR